MGERLNVHHGQVIGGIRAYQLRLFRASVVQNGYNALFAVDDMVIGYDVPFCINNDTRANLLPLRGRHFEFDDGWLYLCNRCLLLSFNRRSAG
jgi:thiamine monophosphate synthase